VSLKQKNYIYVCNPKPGECGRMTLAHARRLVRQGRADWHGPVLDVIEAERRKRLPASKLSDRQAWRDRRLMALAAHKRRIAQELPQ